MAGESCCVPAPPSVHFSEGKEEKLADFDVYSNWPSSATSAVILISDIFGWKAPLLRKLADKVAAAGFVAVVPDYFKDDPFTTFDAGAGWLERNPCEGAVEPTKTLIAEIKSKGIKSVGASGFCWGAKVAILLAKETDLSAIVLLHASLVGNMDVEAVKVPIAILVGELDERTTPQMGEEFKTILAAQNKVDYFVKVFPNARHGWTVRYDTNDEKAVASAYESHEDMINWYKKHLV